MRTLRLAVLVCIALLGAGGALAARTLRNMDEVGAAIAACWNAPVGSGRSFVALSFAFRRDGGLVGPPRPAAIGVAGGAAARRRFAASAVAALERCTPLHLAPALAGSIAGQVFTMRFAAPGGR